MKINNILVVYTNPKSNEERCTLAIVQKTLKKYKINHKAVDRDKISQNLIQNKDLVIAVGGDGTFIRASHFILNKTPLLGVNSNPKYKEGFFMVSKKDDFKDKFEKILSNKYKVKKIHRLKAYINNKQVPELALNEFYIASEKPYHTARYFLNIGGRKEKQKSSGVLISTAAGSHAWIKSAGGKILPIYSDKFEYLVREPYYGRTCKKCSLYNSILDKDDEVEIEFDVGKGVLIVDSLSKEHKFKHGQKVTVKMSKRPLHFISFNRNN